MRRNVRVKGLQWALAILLLLTACAAPAATWQEQYDLGMRYLTEGNYDEAIVAFTAAIEIDPKRAEAYVGVAKAYLGAGDEDAAVEWLQKGMERAGDTTELAAMLEELGIAVPAEAFSQQDAADGAQSGDAGSGEQPRQDEATGQGDEELVRLLWEGVDRSIETESNIVIFGVPLDSMTFDSFQTAVAAQGAEFSDLGFVDNAAMSAFYAVLPAGPSVEGQLFKDGKYANMNWSGALLAIDSGYGYQTGVYGICFGDSFETVLQKLGFHNAAQIANRCTQLAAEHPDEKTARIGEKDAPFRLILRYSEVDTDNSGLRVISIGWPNGDFIHFHFGDDVSLEWLNFYSM